MAVEWIRAFTPRASRRSAPRRSTLPSGLNAHCVHPHGSIRFAASHSPQRVYSIRSGNDRYCRVARAGFPAQALTRTGRGDVGIELRRTQPQAEGYQPHPFGCEVGSHFRHGPCFRRPPCDPGQSDFPSPVLISALHNLSETGLPMRRGDLSADSRAPPPRLVCPTPRSEASATSYPALRLGCAAAYATAEYPEPLCLARARAISRTASEDVTPRSSLVRAHAPDRPSRPASVPLSRSSLQVAVSPC